MNRDLFVLVCKEQREEIEAIRNRFEMRTRGDVVRLCIALCSRLVERDLLLEDFKTILRDMMECGQINDVDVSKIIDRKLEAENEYREKRKEDREREKEKGKAGEKEDEDGAEEPKKKEKRKKPTKKRRARFTPDEVRKIRKLYDAGDVTMNVLAERFDCSVSSIQGVVRYRVFKDVK